MRPAAKPGIADPASRQGQGLPLIATRTTLTSFLHAEASITCCLSQPRFQHVSAQIIDP